MLEKLSIFGFQALWSPLYFVFVALIAALYLSIVIGPLKNKFQGSEPVELKKIIYFLSGLALLYLIKGSPLDLLGHLNFSIHMTQMALLYLTVPPLLLFGTPQWLLRALLNVKFLKKIIKFSTKPLIAILLFNLLFSLYHIPIIFDTIKTDPMLHATVTTVIFLSALTMWCPLINPLPDELGSLSGIQKMGYIFADGILLTPACALIIFSPVAFYTTYTDPDFLIEALKLCVPASQLSSIDLSQAQLFSWLPPHEDQRLGGVVMKIIQEIMYGIILGYNFFQWFKEEKGPDKIDPITILPHHQTK